VNLFSKNGNVVSFPGFIVAISKDCTVSVLQMPILEEKDNDWVTDDVNETVGCQEYLELEPGVYKATYEVTFWTSYEGEHDASSEFKDFEQIFSLETPKE
jgi:hypothetical protein